jgi:dTDP-4-dehydrorhamnose 3,5-epimerase
MKIIETALDGVCLLEPRVFGDSRGYFYESYNRKIFHDLGITAEFVQDNVSRSARGVLRGLHYQLEPHAQGKLVRVMAGEVFDVAVDIRRGSPTFGRWYGAFLNAENKRSLWIPPGFAHGFCVTSDGAEFAYKCTALYAPAHDRSILWNDPAIGIAWPDGVDESLLSDKDRRGALLADAEINYAYGEHLTPPLSGAGGLVAGVR